MNEEARPTRADAITPNRETTAIGAEGARQRPAKKSPRAGGASAASASGRTIADEVKGTIQDVAEQIEKLPVTRRVVEAAREVAEGVEKSPTAARVLERVKSTAEDVEKSPLLAAAHKVLLAGIGAVALAQEEIEDFVNRLVERGQIAEADGKKMLRDVLEKRKRAMATVPSPASQAPEGPDRARDDAEKRIEAVIARMNIPTKDEIDALAARITALTKKVDELRDSS